MGSAFVSAAASAAVVAWKGPPGRCGAPGDGRLASSPPPDGVSGNYFNGAMRCNALKVVSPPASDGYSALLAAATLLSSCTVFSRGPYCQRRLPKVRRSRIPRATSSVQYRECKNRGIDARRLLGTLREVGIGSSIGSSDEGPKRQLPAPKALMVNGPGAALLVRKERHLALERGENGLRPAAHRRNQRLPLLVKYYKPAGVVAEMRSRGFAVEDLRTTVSKAGDRFELDLYHPVGAMPRATSGLLLWSRSSKITEQITNLDRGIVHDFEAKVHGVVDLEQLREALRGGVTLGYAGFEEKGHADVLEAKLLNSPSLQAPKSRVVIRTNDGRDVAREMLKACGHRVVTLKRTRIGMFQLGGLSPGGLEAATKEEEEWACKLGGLRPQEFPGALPSRMLESPKLAQQLPA
mmetsp:Transcript_78748/g.218849  ORF Transcript_78748/g.218849 Transcript_78748/m.218849 type:complete len:408 (+) Transcript_78748:127-1350(+)|eukprot:CAMPEP_0117472522 /NCGR_PEP_ID=MMETSP0784-20121206/8290_1 /TAXON_ID=39447 /ORGANISM="" /LENGTH=407 /DNA_ID=CAMNT_0005266675 /DNA_START=60 /DNA_END=1283 /DNA_ORIENTATION=+